MDWGNVSEHDLSPFNTQRTHGAYPVCLHLLIGRGRTVNVFSSSFGERCPNCGDYIVFKVAPQDEPCGAPGIVTRQGQDPQGLGAEGLEPARAPKECTEAPTPPTQET